MKPITVVSTKGSKWLELGVEHHFCGRCDYEVWPTHKRCPKCGDYIFWPIPESPKEQ